MSGNKVIGISVLSLLGVLFVVGMAAAMATDPEIRDNGRLTYEEAFLASLGALTVGWTIVAVIVTVGLWALTMIFDKD